MKTRKVDVAVIGAGSAGMRAFRAASAHTGNVVLIEGGQYGTTCARVGCMPSKLLIAAAEAAHAAGNAAAFGVVSNEVRVDGAAVMDRVRRERDRFVGFVVDDVEAIPESKRLLGNARFLDDHRLQVGDEWIVNASRIVIATGSSPVVLPFLEGLGDRLVVNDDIFDWTELPESIAVFGPGVIGLELGQALSRLGVRVHMFGVGGLVGPLTDPAVADKARSSFAGDFYFDPDARVDAVARSANGATVSFRDSTGQSQVIEVDFVLAATGRRPNVASLELANTSLPLDDKALPVFDREAMQIGQSHVFIAGDANNDLPLLHEAADEGHIAGDNAGRFPQIGRGKRRSPLGIVFTDPQIAMVGQRYAELPQGDIVVGEASFDDQGRSRVMLQNNGVLRVYANRSDGRFVGAEMFGPRAEHIGHLLAWAHQSGLTVSQMLEMPFYHPVIEEGLRTALRDADAQLRKSVLRAA